MSDEGNAARGCTCGCVLGAVCWLVLLALVALVVIVGLRPVWV